MTVGAGAPELKIIVGSIRPGRVGLPVARWFESVAVADARFRVDFVDLAEVDLPLMNEPQHPRLRQYVHAHTVAWSERMETGDAFVFVTPEYNHGMPAPVKNALDYLQQEWAFKPIAFVSYGGPAGGVRSTEQLKQVAITLRMVPAFRGVVVPLVHRRVADERFESDPELDVSAVQMLDELVQLADRLRPLRAP